MSNWTSSKYKGYNLQQIRLKVMWNKSPIHGTFTRPRSTLLANSSLVPTCFSWQLWRASGFSGADGIAVIALSTQKPCWNVRFYVHSGKPTPIWPLLIWISPACNAEYDACMERTPGRSRDQHRFHGDSSETHPAWHSTLPAPWKSRPGNSRPL